MLGLFIENGLFNISSRIEWNVHNPLLYWDVSMHAYIFILIDKYEAYFKPSNNIID